MDDRRNELVAEKVMGWSKGEQFQKTRYGKGYSYWVNQYGEVSCLPDYANDPAADYEVLRRVSEVFTAQQLFEYVNATARIWNERSWQEKGVGAVGIDAYLHYRVGDHARAALAALGIEEAKG